MVVLPGVKVTAAQFRQVSRGPTSKSRRAISRVSITSARCPIRRNATTQVLDGRASLSPREAGSPQGPPYCPAAAIHPRG